MMQNEDIAWLWATAYGSALIAFAARITWRLGGAPDPPEDAAERRAWARRRLWLVISEFAALPLFASSAVLIVVQGWVSPVTGVFASMLAGALGFSFFLHAIDTILRRRIGMEKGDGQ